MIPMTLAEVAAVVGGEVHGDPGLVVTDGAYVDSRHPPGPAALFVAVLGERVDGHDYAAAAHAVLGSRATPAPTVVVPDPVLALGTLSRHVVDTVAPVVVALTGSQGKTGTKDYLGHVLAGAGPTVATRGNHNNEIGVPLTVLEATEDTRYLVVEMGARGIGHIDYLCRLAPPRVAGVLNVGTAHLSEFGSREQIAAAKGEIVAALPDDGVAVLNADDDLVAAMARRTPARTLTFGAAGDVSWRDVRFDDLGRPAFELGYDGGWYPVRLTASGGHQVANAAAAATLALAAGLDPALVAERLSAARPASPWRMELHERADGLVVINDAYNANPASMAAALDALAQIASRRPGRAVAVLGEMLELGDDTRAGHLEVGRYAAGSGVDLLVTVGETAAQIGEGAREATGWSGEVLTAAGRDQALELVRENVAAADVVLVKASRGAALEHVADGLVTEGEGGR
jgi:UDP-N-acetylmuramoyl-tripeptide--D-alanyl-D-alanine ligase